jgi:hypothetical protein
MERVVRSTKVPTADLQSLAYEQVAFPSGRARPGRRPHPAARATASHQSTPIPPFQAASPSPIQARSDWAALRWWGKAPGLSGCFAT